MRVRPLALLLLVLAGCDTFSDPIGASLRVAAAPPASAVLTLRNTGDEPISIGPIPCEVDLEVEEGGDWRSSGHELLATCVDVLTQVSPGDEIEGTYPMKGVPNGTYRFRVVVSSEDGGSTRDVVSNEIAVVSAGS